MHIAGGFLSSHLPYSVCLHTLSAHGVSIWNAWMGGGKLRGRPFGLVDLAAGCQYHTELGFELSMVGLGLRLYDSSW